MANPVALVRPLNLVAIALAVWVGARLGRAPLEWSDLAIPVLIGACGYARNDAVDLAADRINRPGRPLPSGILSARTANLVAALAFAAAIVLLLVTRRDAGSIAIAAASATLLVAYSPWLKERGPLGPASIALLAALAVVWGAAPGSVPDRAILPALLAGASNFSRECVKHLEDLRGDLAAGRRTWAATGGSAVVTRAARLGLLAALLVLPLPATAGGLRPIFLAAAIPTAGLLFVWALIALGGVAPAYSRVSAALKLATFCGLAAFAAAS